ncbi:uncharacterized protein LOC123864322 isoform X2 [Maniola jurtina]|uniref:uncharacterized protein LOC123864322 isoform X2 n=1 Tax=Maniola jurtina TaxID=191418 RepID=UPI001E6890EC|nr:uncharacterized protein LOC123864322 isoform X2 [Maniola jurtina]
MHTFQSRSTKTGFRTTALRGDGERAKPREPARGGARPVTALHWTKGVRLHPCLWNPMHPEYREVHVKDEAWQRVVDRYNNKSIPNIQVAKTEWKKLRDNHRDALKRAKLGKNKLLPAQITTWKYAKAMQFLEPHMKYRITENIEFEAPSGVSGSVKNSEHDVTTTDNAENVSINGHVSKKRCVECKSDLRHEGEALESFFNCILQTTRTMPLWMQTQVKKKIFAVIIEAEECLSGQEQEQDLKEQHEALVPIEKKIKTEIYNEDSCDNEYS